nr:prolipoprotein diacylglyceryl transferase [Allofustis seminis]
MKSLLGVIQPEAFKIGPITIYWYGIIIMVGMILAITLSQREAEKFALPDDFMIDLSFIAIPLGIVGARIYYVLFELPYYMAHPEEIIRIWEGGLAIYGGVLAGAAVSYFYAKKKRVPFLFLLDMLAPHLLLAQGIGRWGNFVNQEAHGAEVSLSFLKKLHLPEWMIQQMNIDGIYYHPTFLYESIWNIIGFVLIYVFRLKKEWLLRGEAFYSYCIWYGVGRFFIEGMRTDSLYIGSLRISQLVSLVMVLFGIFSLVKRRYFTLITPPYYSEGIK